MRITQIYEGTSENQRLLIARKLLPQEELSWTYPAVKAARVATVKLLINGSFIESKTAEWHDVVNPASQEVIAQVPFATDAEIDAAVAAAKEAYKTWKNTPLAARARIMLKLQALVREHMSRIAHTLSAEQGKTLADAEGDIFRGLEVVEHACSIGSLQLGEFAENVAGGVDTYTIRQPIGVCAGITPFNFPAMIPLWMFPMAIVCGNTFVLKPSEQDPLTPMLLAELALQAGIPPGVLNIVHGGKRSVDALCTHPEHRRRLLRGFDGRRHARIQPGFAARQAGAMHDGRQESRRGDAGCQQGAVAQCVGRSDFRRGRTALHGHLGHRPGRRGAEVDTGHRRQGEGR